MLRHIALFLLSLGLALPAIAAPLCHEAAQPAASASADPAMMDHAAMGHATKAAALPHHLAPPHNDGKDSPSPANRHECIGCVARFALPSLISPATLPPTALAPASLPTLRGIASTPDVPPPRS
jgi:hypothetical protein